MLSSLVLASGCDSVLCFCLCKGPGGTRKACWQIWGLLRAHLGACALHPRSVPTPAASRGVTSARRAGRYVSCGLHSGFLFCVPGRRVHSSAASSRPHLLEGLACRPGGPAALRGRICSAFLRESPCHQCCRARQPLACHMWLAGPPDVAGVTEEVNF